MGKIFIINPVSAKAKLEQAVAKIRKSCVFNEKEDVVLYSEYRGHVAELAEKNPECEIYSVGGDGTFLEAVNGVKDTGSPVCFLPMGSGNDFIRSLSTKTDFDSVLKGIESPVKKTIDMGLVDGECFANIASVGFDAEIVKNAEKFKKIPIIRKLSYILSIFYTLVSNKNIKFKLTVDGEVVEDEFLLIAVANGKFYGGGVQIAPKAIMDDGYFDVVYAKGMTRLQVLAILPGLLNGSHLKNKNVTRVLAKNVTIESDKPFLRNTDGDLKEVCRTEMSIKEMGLTVILPSEGLK